MRHGVKLSAVAMLSAGLLCGGVNAADVQGNTDTTTTQSLAAKNKAASEAFLATNQKNPGVVTLANGLQYKIIEPGKGESPKESDVVVVDYAGTLIDGTEFDSSYKRGQAASFQVSGVIPGWTQALQLMKPGATWELYIPASLAYGSDGVPPVIGPNQALIFKVHLVSVNKA